MTTLQEAARKALYALEASIDGDHPYYEDQLTAIESLRTALAQQGEQAKPVAYITDTHQGPMVWTTEMYDEACTYCDDGEFPVPLYTVAPQPTSGDYALGYAEGFNDACKPAPQAQPEKELEFGFDTAQQPAQWEREALKNAVYVAIAGLFEHFTDDVSRVFSLAELQQIADHTEHLRSQQVEDIYRKAFDLLQSAQPVAQPLSDSEIEKLREKTFSTYNPYCPVDSKSMRKAVRAAEAAHGIREVK